MIAATLNVNGAAREQQQALLKPLLRFKRRPHLHFSKPFFIFKSLVKPSVDQAQESAAPRHSTRHTTLSKKVPPTVTSTRPSQSVSHKPSDTILTRSRAVHFAFPLPQASAPSVEFDSSIEWLYDGSIEPNNEVEKEPRMEVVHTLTHRNPIWCAKFSRDWKYLAIGCQDGKAYIYHVKTGIVKWQVSCDTTSSI
jgi:hypothetical protein